jgi:hypothetical protein
MHAADDDLQRCRRELLRLQIENAALRYAATTFGDLAERLNAIVDRHRRNGALHEDQGRLPFHRLDVPGLESDETG